MRILKKLSLAFVFLLAVFGIAACGETKLKVFENITLEDKTFVYDGNIHSLEVTGDLPEGTNVEYYENDKIEVGTYSVRAILNCNNYVSKELEANLTIEKANYDLSSFSFKDATFKYDGLEHSLRVTGNLPEGLVVNYENNFLTEPGSIEAIAKFENHNPNYNDVEDMKATLTITENGDYAKLTFIDGKDTYLRYVLKGGNYDPWVNPIHKPGYEIKWSEDLTNVREDMIINCYSKIIEYSIDYDLNGGINNPDNPYSYTIEDIISLKNPTKLGYKFAGWTTEDNSEPTLNVEIKNETENKKYIANWISNGESYKIRYHYNDQILKEETVKLDSKFTFISFNIELNPNYDFVRWVIDGKEYKAGDTITFDFGKDIDIYAKVEEKKETDPNLLFRIDSDNNAIILGVKDKTVKSIVIPTYIKQNNQYYTVTGIEKEAFEVCDCLENVTLPSGLISIGDYAFKFCVKLKSIAIPKTVTKIGYIPFWGCSFDSIIVEEGNSVYDSRNNCNAIIETKTNRLILGSNNTIIPNSVTKVETRAFSGVSGLESIVIPKSVNSIGYAAFEDCKSLNSIIVEEGNSVYDSRNNCQAIIETATNTLIQGCNTTIIPDSIKNIKSSAFAGCQKLMYLTIPEGVRKIEAATFQGCYNLISVVIPNSVEEICGSAFNNCNLNFVFYSGTKENWENISIKDYNDSLLKSQKEYDSKVNELSFVDSEKYKYITTNTKELIFLMCKDKSIACFDFGNELSEYKVISIGKNAFLNCPDLVSVILPSSIANIREFAFANIINVFYSGTKEDWNKINIENSNICLSNAQIEYESQANQLTLVDNDKIKYITTNTNDLIFLQCKDASIVVFDFEKELSNYRLISIAPYSFYNCNDLIAIVLPQDLKSIGNMSFSGFDYKQTRVFYSGTQEDWNKIAIDENNDYLLNSSIEYESKVTELSLVDDDKLKYITTDANDLIFLKCKDNEIKIFNFAKDFNNYENIEICENAFADCHSLTSIILTKGVRIIKRGAFNYVWNLTNIFYSGTKDEWNKIAISENNEKILSAQIEYESKANELTLVNNEKSEYIITDTNKLILLEYKNNNAELLSLTKEFSGYEIITLADGLFYDFQKLISIILPSSVQQIANSAFSMWDSHLTHVLYSGSKEDWNKINIGNNNNALLEAHIEYQNKATDLSFIDNEKYRCIATDVNQIILLSFKDHSIKELDFTKVFSGYEVISLGNYAFDSCHNLESVVIPNSITSMGSAPFIRCSSLKQIIVEKGNPTFYSGYSNDAIIEKATNKLIQGCKATIIPNNVEIIGKGAFRSIYSQSYIEIPDSVTIIEESAFAYCENIVILSLGRNLTSIGMWAFDYCIGIQNLTIPSSVTQIDSWAFHNCQLNSISVDENNPKYDSRNNCNAIIETETNELILGCKNTMIPNTVTKIGFSSFDGCNNLKNITIPSSVTSIDRYAFNNCGGLISVIIPNSVINIGESAFRYCHSLMSIEVEEGNSKYDSRNSCNAIIETETNKLIQGCKRTIIPNTVEIIGNYAFAGVDFIKIVIPDSVTIIEDYAFTNCNSLISIVIPSSVTSIGAGAFSTYDSSLTNVFYSGTKEEWDKIVIGNDNEALLKAEIEYNSKVNELLLVDNSQYRYILTNTNKLIFVECKNKGVKQFDFANEFNGKEVITICRSAFSVCDRLTYILIPETVASMGDNAFSGCRDLVIHCEIITAPKGWKENWNPNNLDVVWGYSKA